MAGERKMRQQILDAMTRSREGGVGTHEADRREGEGFHMSEEFSPGSPHEDDDPAKPPTCPHCHKSDHTVPVVDRDIVAAGWKFRCVSCGKLHKGRDSA